jgi:FkbM family methyltransferase
MFPDRTVRRRVQGVELKLPWSHPLPDYARSRPTYGQNLVDLAAVLSAGLPTDSRPLRMLDVGANIGDSALQVAARTGAEVLCVEADPYWLRYLEMNVGDRSDIDIIAALLTTDDHSAAPTAAVRAHGTTHFVSTDSSSDALQPISASALRAAYPRFDRIRLVKSDTDGFDPAIVPAVARAWHDSGPVIFFEFDPTLARSVGDEDPFQVWSKLAELGYSEVAVWDNGGDPLGRVAIEEAAQRARILEPRPIHLGYHFWDVAVCRADDADAIAAFDTLMPHPFAEGEAGN